MVEIAAIKPLSHSNDLDCPYWIFSPNGNFTVKLAFNCISDSSSFHSSASWKYVWNWNGLKRIRFFLWLCLHDHLLTNVERGRRHLTSVKFYESCHMADESLIHALRDYLHAEHV